MSYEAASKTEYGPSNIAGARIKPRVSELKNDGMIEDTGKRRKNPTSRMSATIWRAKA